MRHYFTSQAGCGKEAARCPLFLALVTTRFMTRNHFKNAKTDLILL
jgi:hypothetical protein